MEAPRPASSFVGRTAEREALVDALSSGARLVTVSGPAGVGKTRLALEHVAGLRSARFCALEDATDGDGVLEAVAAAFAVSPQAGGTRGSFLRQIGDALDARADALVVLDGVERVLEPVVAALATWLSETRRPRFLVTSRERLGLAGERVLELAPLPCPGEAVTLFCERAAAARPGFAPSASDLAVIGGIVGTLDGLPLAIELAAARIAVLSPAELAARLDRRLDVLVSAGRGGSARQRTLRRALDASWDELDPAERAALAQLSVFRGGLSVEVAERVLELPGPARDVPGVLEALRRKSLLWARAVPGTGGRLRLGMLESIRVYAAERLAATGGEERLRRRHADALLQQGRLWAARVDAEAHACLALERENLLAVLRWSQESPARAALGLEVVVVLDELLAARDPAEAHLALLDLVLRSARAGGAAPALRARALLARGRVAATLGRAGAAGRDLAAALKIAEREDDDPLQAETLVATGAMQYMSGQMELAQRAYRAARDAARRSRSPRAEAAALTGLAAVVHVQGRMATARRLNERALALQRAGGDRRREGRTLARLGFLHQDCGELDEAHDCYEQALEIHRASQARGSEAIVLGYLGNLERRRGDLAAARDRYHEALGILRELGDRQFEPVFLMDEGIALLDHGRPEEARAVLEEALARLERAPNRYIEALVRGHLGVALAERGAAIEAGRMLAAAVRRCGADRGPVATVLRLQRAHLAVAAARGAGAGRAARAALTAARRTLAANAKHRSEHVRLAHRILGHAVERTDPPADALVVAEDGTFFTPPRGGRVDLATRESLRRLLCALAEEWRHRPGAPLSVEALFARGWPGERAAPAAAKNRVRVGLATLRSLGLRSALATSGGGYLLRPATRVVVVGPEV